MNFDYVLEQLRAETRWHEALAERVTGFIGRPYFFGVHLLWFTLWALVNTGMVALIRRFDAYPYALLGILLAAEAIFITGFLLISQNRQSRHADKRAELDYEVNVRTYRQIQEIADTLHEITHRLDAMEAALSGQRPPP